MAKVFYDYTISENLRYPSGPTVVSLQLLSADNELLASRLGKYEMMKTHYEAVKLSIAQLDGKNVTQASGDIDAFWDKSPPKLRSLLVNRYLKLSSPNEEEEDDFLGSEKVRVVD